MVSPTQWTWVWANSGRWWRTGKLVGLQSIGLQRVGHDLATKQQQYCTYLNYYTTKSGITNWGKIWENQDTMNELIITQFGKNTLTFCLLLNTACREGNGNLLQYCYLENPMDGGAWWAAVHGVAKSQTRLSNFTFTFHFHALEKAMATHSSVLAWRIPGMGDPGGLQSMGLHRIGHNWSDLATANTA